MTDLEIVQRMQEVLRERGHTVRKREDGTGAVCLVGAYEYARWGAIDGGATYHDYAYNSATQLLLPEIQQLGFSQACDVNDRHLKTLPRALEFLHLAERRLLAESSPEPVAEVPDDVHVERSPESSRELIPA